MVDKNKKDQRAKDLEADETAPLRRSEPARRSRGYDSELNQINNQIENNYNIYNYLCFLWMGINTIIFLVYYFREGPMKTIWIIEIVFAYFAAVVALLAKMMKTILLVRFSIILICIYLAFEVVCLTIIDSLKGDRPFFSGISSGLLSIKFFAVVCPPLFLLLASFSLKTLLKKRDSINLARNY